MAIPSRQALVLTERESAVCTLHGEDVEFLLAHHRTHLELRPTRDRDTFQLRPRGYVGVILTPRTRLTLRPKIPLRNLCSLLDAGTPQETAVDLTELSEGERLLNWLALRLARLLRERAAVGLQRSYAERRAHSAFVQGKIDVAEQLRSNPARKDRLACQFEEFTPDVLLNQIPKATAEWVLRLPFLADSVRQQLRQALGEFLGVSAIALQGEKINWSLLFTEPTRPYWPLLYLCRQLLESLHPAERVGQAECPGFLLNLETAFENFCTRRVTDFFQAQTANQKFQVLAQEVFYPHTARAGVPTLHFRPDLLIRAAGKQAPALVLDVKWKSAPFPRADLYQILSYCAGLGCAQGMLLYPGSRNKTWRYDFRASNITIFLQQLQLTGDLASCESAVERWQRKVKRLCEKANAERQPLSEK